MALQSCYIYIIILLFKVLLCNQYDFHVKYIFCVSLRSF